MTLIRHELRQSRISLAVWTVSIGFLIAVCIFLFPEMKGEMDGISSMFASMGSFTQAFGMDKINFGTLTGFYAVECGNILGLGGAFFAALCAVSVLEKEEKEHTAEFLLTHPVSRVQILTEKLIAVMLQIILMNAVVYILSVGSIALVGESIPWKEITLLHLAFLLLQIEIAGICFGISAFLRRGSIGIGLGVAILLYFLNLIANISDQAEFLNYFTPFGYADGAEIMANVRLDGGLILLGMAYGLCGIAAAYVKYSKKDIV
ncbi:MAG: ABC transporter permease subunit [Candidatus Limivivens sp.]|nr:ABC transporter permease subunit [Candidatus Limivivens sp.]